MQMDDTWKPYESHFLHEMRERDHSKQKNAAGHLPLRCRMEKDKGTES